MFFTVDMWNGVGVPNTGNTTVSYFLSENININTSIISIYLKALWIKCTGKRNMMLNIVIPDYKYLIFVCWFMSLLGSFMVIFHSITTPHRINICVFCLLVNGKLLTIDIEVSMPVYKFEGMTTPFNNV